MAPQTFTHADGRKTDYLVSGAQDGFPLIFIHGTPGSYTVSAKFAAACEGKGIKVITLSRAGYGGSTRNKGRRVVDAVADIQAVLEHLGVKKCVVGGKSGGGPHSLACAARLPGCVASLVVAGVAPYDADGLDFLAGQGQSNVDEFGAALEGEEPLQKFCQAERPGMLAASPKGLTEAMATLLPEADMKAILEDEDTGVDILKTIQEALRLSCDGWVDDDLAFTRPWGFELSEIKVPVFLYQGTVDKMVPLAHGEWLAAHLPEGKVKARLLEGEGHISIFSAYMNEMLDNLLAVAKE
ncbi:lpha beta hydrolase [Diaporthe amygdali]|uniref:lpha beta hydrolase n=1 Tax=Phomopsis amygdali TaxID=1214568 RepID=UPI0022FDCFB5|nr:lpha beta hydrolase [Diaporthe amygdali]KAJ0114820.1 lpha beta hydrolase [Diaporthe amygdali]